jgi:hypothetical protein
MYATFRTETSFSYNDERGPLENFSQYVKSLQSSVATAPAIGILTNLKDIKRYQRISTML